MMLTRMSRKARPVGKVEVLARAEGEEGFNFTIRDNFRIPDCEAMEAEPPQGKGIADILSLLVFDLGALGDPDAKGVPKKQVEKGVRFRKKKTHEPGVVPPLVPQVAEGRCRWCWCW
ncbi:hypothetical protein Hanom_Chr01g00029831 [Helianthus anomalus]